MSTTHCSTHLGALSLVKSCTDASLINVLMQKDFVSIDKQRNYRYSKVSKRNLTTFKKVFLDGNWRHVGGVGISVSILNIFSINLWSFYEGQDPDQVNGNSFVISVGCKIEVILPHILYCTLPSTHNQHYDLCTAMYDRWRQEHDVVTGMM